jgi:5'-deoxynucleotidase YfbR-like HD superfamily hydrolase
MTDTPTHNAERERLKQKRFIQTFTGKAFFPLDPRPADVCIEDIAHALALKNRYTGHTREPYSVAEHCYRASLLVPPAFALPALLHDAAEAYLPDLAAPIKRRFWVGDSRTAENDMSFAQLERLVLNTIFHALDLFALRDVAESEQVKKADLQMLAWEARDLLAFSGKAGDPTLEDWGLTENPPSEGVLRPFSWNFAEECFLKRFHDLTRGAR